jgi:Mor family transcriptional regulator
MPKDYPSLFSEINQMIGEAAAAKVIAQFGGGQPLYIPVKLKAEHPLCQLLGGEVAQRLADEFGGLTVEIPRGAAQQIELRNSQILVDRAAGLTQNEIARKYQLTTRTIRKVVSMNRRKDV